jgi:hypothetical protein
LSEGMFGDARDHIWEPGAGIDAVECGGDDQLIRRGYSFTSSIGSGEQPVFSAESDAAECTLGHVFVRQIPPSLRKRVDSSHRFSI